MQFPDKSIQKHTNFIHLLYIFIQNNKIHTNFIQVPYKFIHIHTSPYKLHRNSYLLLAPHKIHRRWAMSLDYGLCLWAMSLDYRLCLWASHWTMSLGGGLCLWTTGPLCFMAIQGLRVSPRGLVIYDYTGVASAPGGATFWSFFWKRRYHPARN